MAKMSEGARERKRERERERYYRLKENGVCVCCQKELAVEGHVMCQKCLDDKKRYYESEKEERHEYEKKERLSKKRNHICKNCGKVDAYTLNGRTLCYECAEKSRIWKYERRNNDEEYRKAENKNHSKMVCKWKEQGLCPHCGKRKPADGYAWCSVCRSRSHVLRAENRRERGILPRESGVRCWQCNKEEPIEGKRLCKACYDKKMEIINAVNERRRERKEAFSDAMVY